MIGVGVVGNGGTHHRLHSHRAYPTKVPDTGLLGQPETTWLFLPEQGYLSYEDPSAAQC